MQLIPDSACPAWAEVSAAIDLALTHRLKVHDPAPLAVAFSGGGDSLALLLGAAAWARSNGREVVVLTVDHGLSPLSADWSQGCERRSARLGLRHRLLPWTGPKPIIGLPAAARRARHRLLADAARDVGAAVILLGHTSDDVLEAGRMRAAGARVGDPSEWSPSPAWPEGRGVFLLRPLLGVRRQTLRRALRDLGESWIDDPANDDEASLRTRVRRQSSDSDSPPAREPPDVSAALAATRVGWGGDLAIDAPTLASLDAPMREHFLGLALLCAAGTNTPPRRERLARLSAELATLAPMSATLAGAQAESDGVTVRITRDAGDLFRRGSIEGDYRNGVFDGRFEVAPPPPGALLVPMTGFLNSLPAHERRACQTLPPAARRSLPALLSEDHSVSCPLLNQHARKSGRMLVGERLAHACRRAKREADVGGVGETPPTVLNRNASVERPVYEPA